MALEMQSSNVVSINGKLLAIAIIVGGAEYHANVKEWKDKEITLDGDKVILREAKRTKSGGAWAITVEPING